MNRAPSAHANTYAGRSGKHRHDPMTGLAPVPSEGATCANCGAQLVDDQRYCLSCGHPVSPVRLAFLDVLETERQAQPGGAVVPAAPTPVAYTPYVEPPVGPAWLRRYAPLFAVASVLLLALLAGLLVGHWATQSKGNTGPQIIKIEGLGGAALGTAAATTTPSTATSTTAAGEAKSAKGEEAKEQAEAKAEEEKEKKEPAKAPAPAKNSEQAVSKLEKTTGKKHEEELNKISTAPIEVK